MVFTGLISGVVLLWIVLQLVRRPQWLAEPNERSSHTQPTPTMGGIAIVVVVLAYLGYLLSLEPVLAGALCAGLGAMALVGMWDDLKGLSAAFRLTVHFAAAAGLLWALHLTCR